MGQGVSMGTRGNTNRGGREGRGGGAFGLGLGGCGQAPANLCVGVGIEAMRACPSPLCVRGEITSICCLIRYAYIGWNVCHHSNKPTQTQQTKSKQGGVLGVWSDITLSQHPHPKEPPFVEDVMHLTVGLL